jgi:UDP-glucose 4-epimerase
MVSIYCSYIWKKKPLIIKGSLNRYRNFTYISDCVNILAESIKNNKLNKFEIFNLSNGIKTTVKDLIKVIFKTNNIKKCKIINENNTPGDSFGYDANNLYLKKKFNNYKFLKLEEGIKKYFLWINMIKKKNLNNSHPYKINKDYKL